MPTLRILYDVDGWAYHHRARALEKHAPPDFDVSLARLARLDRPDEIAAALGAHDPDLIFVLDTAAILPLRHALDARGWRAKLIGSWNAGWPLQLPLFFDAYRQADAMVINNATAWRRVGRLPRTYLLPNGVDRDVFRVRTAIDARAPRVLWTGSELGRRRKGYDRLVVPLQRRLREQGIDCELQLVDSYGDKRAPDAMAAWYDRGTVLVCASAAEGTPNPALEAAACGCTIVSTPVGNMPELIRDGENGYLVARTVDALVEAVRAACTDHRRLAAAMQRDIQEWGWDRRGAAFFDAFREMLEGRQPGGGATLDLGDQVTAFVTTVGAPSYEVCRDLLRLQDCAVRLEVIDHVAPMSAAFQRMLDRCTTPFFVQVDEDMLLHPHALRTLYEKIATADPRVAMVVGELHDAHLDRRIEGVKIYRHAIVRRYPFADAQSFEKLQARQMQADGYVIERLPGDGRDDDGIVGLHGTHWTARSIYERYALLEGRRRRQPRALSWFEPYPEIFLERVLEDPTELNVAALMGVLSAVLLPHEGPGAAKDFRLSASPPGFAEAQRFDQELRPPRPTRGAGGGGSR